MRLIKLDATDSTNDYLKLICNQSVLENFTVVTAQHQTNGRGQMGSSWNTEEGKNLIMSILIKNILKNNQQIFDLNIAVALAVATTLNDLNLPKVTIKWPNDIMSDSNKIGGILIENSFKADSAIESIVGIGLNVNQTNFENLPKASSIKNKMKREYSIDQILETVVFNIERNCKYIQNNLSHELWESYHQNLFKINVPMPFEDEFKHKFMAIITGVTAIGKLKLRLDNDFEKVYGVKEIQLLY